MKFVRMVFLVGGIALTGCGASGKNDENTMSSASLNSSLATSSITSTQSSTSVATLTSSSSLSSSSKTSSVMSSKTSAMSSSISVMAASSRSEQMSSSSRSSFSSSISSSSISSSSATSTATGICPENAVLCDNFENDSINSLLWEPDTSVAPEQSHFVIDNTIAIEGTRSLHLKFGQGGGTGAILLPSVNKLSTSNGWLYVRFYFRFGAIDFPGFHPAWVTIAESNPTWDKFNQFANPQIGFGYIRQEPGIFLFPPDQWQLWSNHDIKANEWRCAEMAFFAGTAPGYTDEKMQVFIDNIEIDAMYADDSRWFFGDPQPLRWLPDLNQVYLRFGNSSLGPDETEGAFNMWIDAVAVANERVGCLE